MLDITGDSADINYAEKNIRNIKDEVALSELLDRRERLPRWGAEFADHSRNQKRLVADPPLRWRQISRKQPAQQKIVTRKLRWSKATLALYPRLAAGGVAVSDHITRFHLDSGQHVWTVALGNDADQSALIERERKRIEAQFDQCGSGGADAQFVYRDREHQYRFFRIGGAYPTHLTRDELAARYGKDAAKITDWTKRLEFPAPDAEIARKHGLELWAFWSLRIWERGHMRRIGDWTAADWRAPQKPRTRYACDHFPHISLPPAKKLERLGVPPVLPSRIPSQERERHLIAEWQTKNDDASKDALIREFSSLAEMFARQSPKYGEQADDLVSAALLGIMKAADKFDLTSQWRFSTYAFHWARAELQACVIGSSLAEKESAAVIKLRQPRSLHASLGDEGETLGDQCIVGVYDTESDADEGITPEQISAALDRLTERERCVIQKRYLEENPSTLADLGKELVLSAERVRQIEGVAIEKLTSALVRGTDDKSGAFDSRAIARDEFNGRGQRLSKSVVQFETYRQKRKDGGHERPRRSYFFRPAKGAVR